MIKELEALECSLKLYKMVESAGNDNGFNLNEAWEYHETIKQTLIKAQKQEKALEIIKKKNVNIGLVNVLGSVEQYNQTYVYDNMLNVKWCLTREEFDLLEEVFL